MYPRSYAQYTLLERLGVGGMSQVDLARKAVEDANYVRFVVIKRIKANATDDESFVRMFKDEARITSELRHTNIAQLYDFGRVGEEYYLALEYIAGADLRRLLNLQRKTGAKTPVRIALRVVHEVLNALEYAHSRKDTLGQPMRIIHRDVNPRNIMVSTSGEIKLIDFGVAKATNRLERTKTDNMKGKVAYMAPEQIASNEFDHRIDLFSLGLTLLEMLNGGSVFKGMDQTRILLLIAQGKIPKFDVPEGWGAAGRALAVFLSKSTAFNENQRFANAAMMRRELETMARGFQGMATADEVAAWVEHLSPGIRDDVRNKVDQYSGIILPASTDDRSQSFAISKEDSSGTLSNTQTSTLNSPMVVAAGLGSVSVMVMALALVVIIVAALIAISLQPQLLLGWQDEPDIVFETGNIITHIEPDEEPNVLGVEQAVDPSPTIATDKTQTATSTTTNLSKEPEPNPGAGEDRVVDVGEADEPEPVDSEDEADQDAGVTTVVDQPDPTPTTPVVTGTIQATAKRKGVRLRIDGEETEHRTGDTFDWPVGKHRIEADGYVPVSVVVEQGLPRFVILKEVEP